MPNHAAAAGPYFNEHWKPLLVLTTRLLIPLVSLAPADRVALPLTVAPLVGRREVIVGYEGQLVVDTTKPDGIRATYGISARDEQALWERRPRRD